MFSSLTLYFCIKFILFNASRKKRENLENFSANSSAGDAVASLCLGSVERGIRTREQAVGVLACLERRDARGHRDLHAG